MKKHLLAAVLMLFSGIFEVFSQKRRAIDSLHSLLNTAQADTQQIILNSQIAEYYRGNEPDSTIKYCRRALDLCAKYKLPQFKIKSLNSLAITYCILGEYGKGRDHFMEYLQLAQRSGDLYNIGNAYGNIGITYSNQGIYSKTLEYYLKGLQYMERSGRLDGIANITGNLGTVYLQLRNSKNAIFYLNKAVMYQRKRADSSGLVSNYINLASVYSRGRNYPVALDFIERALRISKAEEDHHTYAVTLIDKADIFCETEKFKEQILLLKESEAILLRQKDEPNLAQVYELFGRGYTGLGDYKNAEAYLLKGVALSKRSEFLTIQASCYDGLATCYQKQGLLAKALQAKDSLSLLKDSLFNSQSTEQVAQMQTLYETDKKEQENKLLQEKNESASKTIQQQRYIGVAVGVICVLLLAFAFVIYRSNKQKQKVNVELARKNILIEKQKQLVEEKQKEILDSIQYARRIQSSLLTSEKYISRNLDKLNRKV